MIRNITYTLFAAVIIACNTERVKPDIKHIQTDITLQRFEQDFMKIDTANMEASEAILIKKYEEFYPIYISQIMGFKKPYDTIVMTATGAEKKLMKPLAYREEIKQYVSNRSIIGLHDSVQLKYGDMRKVEKELETGFSYFRYYWPKKPVPNVITFTSEFAYGSATVDSTILLIGLDMYLGKQYPYYAEFFPQFIINSMDEEYICTNAFRSVYAQHFPSQFSSPKLLDRMIENGKQFFFLDCVLPDAEDYRKISYSKDQLQWCIENERHIWDYFAEHDLFYAEDALTVNRYVAEGPGTTGMPPEAPGNIGSWVGWQIVRAYAAKTNETPQQIFAQSPQHILSKAKYQPPKP